MNKRLFRIINPVVKAILASPVHGLMSHNTLVIQFLGRKSGRLLSTPVSYVDADGEIRCFTSKAFPWWRNLVAGETVTLLLRGQWRTALPEVVIEDRDLKARALTAFLAAVPRDANHAGVRLAPDGTPDANDVSAAVDRLVLIRFTLVTHA